MSTLADAQAAFRQTPSFDTACLFLDVAISEWERLWFDDEAAATAAEVAMTDACAAVRAWLMNQKVTA